MNKPVKKKTLQEQMPLIIVILVVNVLFWTFLIVNHNTQNNSYNQKPKPRAVYQGTIDGASITETDLGGGYKMICATKGSKKSCNKVFVGN